MGRSVASYPPQLLVSDDGDMILLASTQEAAQAYAADYNACDTVHVEPDGWVMDVGWDRENYERKRDFLAETGFTGWWECLGGTHDARTETKKLRRAWKVIFDV